MRAYQGPRNPFGAVVVAGPHYSEVQEPPKAESTRHVWIQWSTTDGHLDDTLIEAANLAGRPVIAHLEIDFVRAAQNLGETWRWTVLSPAGGARQLGMVMNLDEAPDAEASVGFVDPPPEAIQQAVRGAQNGDPAAAHKACHQLMGHTEAKFSAWACRHQTEDEWETFLAAAHRIIQVRGAHGMRIIRKAVALAAEAKAAKADDRTAQRLQLAANLLRQGNIDHTEIWGTVDQLIDK